MYEADRNLQEMYNALKQHWSGLHSNEMLNMGEIGFKEYIAAKNGEPDAIPEVVDGVREEVARQAALAEMLSDSKLREVLEYIAETPENHQKSTQECHKVRNQSWKYWASRVLASGHRLVEESMPDRNATLGFDITDRGVVAVLTSSVVQGGGNSHRESPRIEVYDPAFRGDVHDERR